MSKSDNFDRVERTIQTEQGPDACDLHTTQARNRALLGATCALALGIEPLRGRWKPSILVAVSEAPQTVASLCRRLPQADRRVLVRALRELARDDLLSRSEARYRLTPDGDALVPILLELAAWQGRRHRS